MMGGLGKVGGFDLYTGRREDVSAGVQTGLDAGRAGFLPDEINSWVLLVSAMLGSGEKMLRFSAAYEKINGVGGIQIRINLPPHFDIVYLF